MSPRTMALGTFLLCAFIVLVTSSPILLRWWQQFQISQIPSIIKLITHNTKSNKSRPSEIPAFDQGVKYFSETLEDSSYILLVRNWLGIHRKAIIGKENGITLNGYIIGLFMNQFQFLPSQRILSSCD